MKKSIKILGFVLALALVCGALTIAAFAGDSEITGVKTVDAVNLQDKSEEIYAQALKATSEIQLGAKTKTNYVGRYGQPAVVTSQYDGNNYLTWTVNTDWSVVGGHPENTRFPVGTMGGPTNQWGSAAYIWTSVSTSPSVSNPNTNPLSNYSYYVVEADVRTPSGIIPHQMNFNMFFGYINSGSSAKTVSANLYFEMKEDDVVVFDNTGKVDGYWKNYRTLDNSTWSRITWILEVQLQDDGQTLATYCHVYINGEYGWSYNGIQIASSAVLNGDLSTVCLRELRINFPAYLDGDDDKIDGDERCEYNEAGQQITWTDFAIDNYSVRSVAKNSNSNLGAVISAQSDLTNWDSNTYDPNDRPFGIPVAVNTSTEVPYDSLAKAVAAASDGDTIELLGNVVNTVYVNKGITIDSKGFNCPVAGVNPYIYVEEGGVYYFEESAEDVEVIWGDCTHIEGCDDETHPGGVSSVGLLNANILDTYPKDHNWTWESPEGVVYVLSGWMNVETGELITEDDVIDEELLSVGLLELEPVITTKTYTYEYTDTNGNPAKAFDNLTLGEIVAKAKAGTTIKLIGDVVANAFVQISKKITIDLCGNTIINLQPYDESKNQGGKYALFSVSSNIEFTLTTSEAGAKIFCGHDNGKGSFNGNAIFSASKGAIVKIDGTKGLQTWSTVLYMTYGDAAGELYVTGGEYYDPRSIGDQDSFLQIDSTNHVELKDALLWADRGIIGFGGGGYKTYPTEMAKVIIDGCTFISTGSVVYRSNAYIDATITNSVIVGNINPTVGPTRSGCLAAKEGGTWTLGEGNYIKSGAIISDAYVTYADGVEPHEVNSTQTFTLTMNTFTLTDGAIDVEASTALTVSEETYTFSTYTAAPKAPVKITWYDTDGTTVLGVTNDTLPGMSATAPQTTIMDGWLNVSYTQWTNPEGVETTAVPEDATEYSFTLVENSDALYTAGKVPVYINYDLVLHFKLNIYIPKELPEGVTITGVDYQGSGAAGTAKNLNASGSYVINGKAYGSIGRWPNAAKADVDAYVVVHYTYGGQDFAYTSPTFNVGDYAQQIFDGEYSTAMKQTMLAALKYVEAANVLMNYAVSQEVVDAIASAPVSIESTDVEGGELIDATAISAYVDKIQVVYNNTNGGIQFQFFKTQKSIDDAASVYVIWNGQKSAYSATDATVGNYPQATNEYGKAFWYTHDTRAYDIDGTFTIQVKVGGAVVAECEYSLEVYAAAVKNDCTTAQWNLMMTTLTYAKYAELVKK